MLHGQWSPWAVTSLAVALLCWIMQRLKSWFRRLDVESLRNTTERVLENPVSVGKVIAPSLYSEATKTLTIVVPAYNESRRISPMLDEALDYLQARRNRQGAHFTYEVIVVDDGSSDDTALVVTEFVRRHSIDAVRLIRQPLNEGKGAAVRQGILCARGTLVLFADADGATAIHELETLETALERLTLSALPLTAKSSCKVGMAVGSRAHLQQQAENRRHWLRNYLMHGFHLLVTMVVGGAIRDTQCGFKVAPATPSACLPRFERKSPMQNVVAACFCCQLETPVK
mmetsp:Transcript_17416/g.52219  ORF Transcript_17416/g.52219 Transcript_17416/m.52219 type:complete len:286 (-) Transcript_17416:2846-3703(-)